MEIFSEGEQKVGLVCEELLDICLAKGSRDNMSAVIVAFPALHVGKGKVRARVWLALFECTQSPCFEKQLTGV